VAFFVIRCDSVAAGCGGVQLYGTEYAELKRMYVRPSFRRLGFGRAILVRLPSPGAVRRMSRGSSKPVLREEADLMA
jgi:GNAT superfamily N-acetyltransferase